MDWKSERKPLAVMIGLLAMFFWLPVDAARFTDSLLEGLRLARWYAREHVILCLLPAFFIAGAIGVFVRQAAVMKYLGARAAKVTAYGVASVSGSILAVCSCTILPLFAGIWRMGAGLGPACAFLYSGPAINVLAIILTSRVLGVELGVARAVGAIGFSVVIGLIMHFVFRREEAAKAAEQAALPEPEVSRPLWQNAVFFGLMIGILVLANWGAPGDYRFELEDGRQFAAWVIETPEDVDTPGAEWRLRLLGGPEDGQELIVPAGAVADRQPLPGVWTWVWQYKWVGTSLLGVVFGVALACWFGVAGWWVVLAAAPPAVLAWVVPTEGLGVLVPFGAAVVGVAVITARSGGEAREWYQATWGFARQILPLLLYGVLVAGFLLGRPGHEGLIPARFIDMLVGAQPDTFLTMTGWAEGAAEPLVRMLWPLWTNLFASLFGAFMYFATLTEVPILQGLIGAGMGQGPALALLLAGPALSLPNMLVIHSVMGTRKTVVFCLLVVVMATISGLIYGAWAAV